MKRLLMLSLLVSSITVYADDKHEECNADDSVTAQASALLKVAEKLEVDGCPAPKANDYKALCADIGSKAKAPANEAKFYEYTYEKRIWALSCANPNTDDEDKAKEKIGKMWSKYQKQFKCDSVDFNVQNGNVLKFSLSQNMPVVVETLASYGLDINFIDPADNMNIIDYVDSEIKRLSLLQNSAGTVSVYKEYREALIGLGAKPSK